MKRALVALLLLSGCSSGSGIPSTDAGPATEAGTDAPPDQHEPQDAPSEAADEAEAGPTDAGSPFPDGESCCAAYAQSWISCCASCMGTCLEVDTPTHCATFCAEGPPALSSCTPIYQQSTSEVCGACSPEPATCPQPDGG